MLCAVPQSGGFSLTKKTKRSHKLYLRLCWHTVREGLWGNKEEWRTYKAVQRKFLAKTSLVLFGGFILIEKCIVGTPLCEDEVIALLQQLPQDQVEFVFYSGEIDTHSFTTDWIRTQKGNVVICDYGGSYNSTAFFEFLHRNQEKLEELLGVP